MGKAFIAYRNRADEATLSTGSWEAGLPLNNLKDRILAKPARSTDDTPASTKFRAVFAQPRPIKVVALCRHNMTTDAKYRIRAYSDAGFTTLIYDSGWLAVWASLYETLDLEWEDDNYWTGTLSEEDRLGFYWNLIHILPEKVYQQYWLIELDDTANPDTYVEIGRLFMADGWSPVTNIQYGAAIGYESRTEVVEAYDGTEYFDERDAYRVARFSFDFMDVEEAMNRAFDIQRIADVSKEVIFVYDQDDTAHLLQRSFLGRLRKLNLIEQPYFGKFATDFEVKELL